MKNVKKLVVGGLAAAGLIVAGYRTYELRKLRKAVEEEVIDIEPEKVEELTDSQN